MRADPLPPITRAAPIASPRWPRAYLTRESSSTSRRMSRKSRPALSASVITLLENDPGEADGRRSPPRSRLREIALENLPRPVVRSLSKSRLLAPRTSRSIFRGARSLTIAMAAPTSGRRPPSAYLHLGLYAYRRDFLLQLATLPPSPLELTEKLEQLRACLKPVIASPVGIVDEPSVGIDTPDDYRRFVDRWRAGQSG